MNDKYLPIGTVCTIKGNTNKIMIVGFLSLDYNGNLNVYDYKGCIYPKGLFSSSGTLSFNHDDIENVEFMGYTTELHNNLNANLINASVVDTVKDKTKSSTKSKYVFDKNGVIIMDGNYSVSEEAPVEITPKKELTNPFAVKYEGAKENTVESKFKFDKNGVIIADNSVVKQENATRQAYEFDKNGFIIADNTASSNVNEVNTSVEKSKSNNLNEKYKFDENGVIIAEN